MAHQFAVLSAGPLCQRGCKGWRGRPRADRSRRRRGQGSGRRARVLAHAREQRRGAPALRCGRCAHGLHSVPDRAAELTQGARLAAAPNLHHGVRPGSLVFGLNGRTSTEQGFWMVSRRLTKRSLAIAKANAQAGADAALTIAARTQRLLAPGGRQSDKTREAHLMVQEKIDATIEGAFAAQMAWGSFFIKAAFGGVRTPNDVSAGLTGIAEAAAPPARRPA